MPIPGAAFPGYGELREVPVWLETSWAELLAFFLGGGRGQGTATPVLTLSFPGSWGAGSPQVPAIPDPEKRKLLCAGRVGPRIFHFAGTLGRTQGLHAQVRRRKLHGEEMLSAQTGRYEDG